MKLSFNSSKTTQEFKTTQQSPSLLMTPPSRWRRTSRAVKPYGTLDWLESVKAGANAQLFLDDLGCSASLPHLSQAVFHLSLTPFERPSAVVRPRPRHKEYTVLPAISCIQCKRLVSGRNPSIAAFIRALYARPFRYSDGAFRSSIGSSARQ